MPKFLSDFMDINKYQMSDLIMSAIELDITLLRDIVAAKMALELRGKSTQEMREWYEFTEEEISFTPEELERNKWEEEEAKHAFGEKW